MRAFEVPCINNNNNCTAGAGNEDCFQCKPIPRVYLHLQRGLPARDFKTCEDGQYLSPGASTATFLGKRCGKCQKTLNNMARHLPHGTSCAQKRDFVQNLFYSRSCGRPEWWSNADDQVASGDFTCALNEEYLFRLPAEWRRVRGRRSKVGGRATREMRGGR